MRKLKGLLFLITAGSLILCGCSKNAIQDDKVYKADLNPKITTNTGEGQKNQPQEKTIPLPENKTVNSTNKEQQLNFNLCSQEEKDKFLQKIQGDWLNENFIANIKNTKSILKSTTAMPFIQIYKEENDFIFAGSTNDFHQGGSYYTKISDIYKAGNIYKIYIVKDGGANPDAHTETGEVKKDDVVPYVLIANNGDKFEYYYGDIKRSFIKMNESLENYANKIILAGKYVNEKGDIYTFTDDSVAIWPNLNSKYQLVLDTVFKEDDFILMGDVRNPISYSYEFKNEQLYIYKEDKKNDSMMMKREKDPYLILKKVE